jgi:hypothetical protein
VSDARRIRLRREVCAAAAQGELLTLSDPPDKYLLQQVAAVATRADALDLIERADFDAVSCRERETLIAELTDMLVEKARVNSGNAHAASIKAAQTISMKGR